MNLPAQQPRPGRDELLTAFRVGLADVEANRSGRLGPRQLRHLNRAAAPWLAAATGLAAGPVVLLLLLPWPAGWWAVLVLVAALGLAWGGFTLRELVTARRPGTVGCLSGAVSVMLLFREHRGFWLTVEGRSFRLPVPPDEIENGAPYRVYYRRSVHRIVAMEPAPELAPWLRAVLPEAG